MPRVWTKSLGCPKNLVDTERVLAGLGPGWEPVDDPAAADLALVNTCGFIEPAVEESVAEILEAADAIAALPAGRRPVLAVGGCLVSRYGEADLAPELAEVDLWLPVADLAAWPARIAAALAGRGRPVPPLSQAPSWARRVSTGPGFAYLKIGEGCGHKCAFCTIPAIRGPASSRPRAELLDEARALIDGGARELIVVAQDVTAYGREAGGQGGGRSGPLVDLLDGLLSLHGLDWLRLMYLYPAGVTDELLSFMAGAGPAMLPYFDVPLQHADPDILKAMGRPFANDPRRVVERIRAVLPHAALRTSLIVGYPGEGEAHFGRLRDFVAWARFNHLGVFTWWPEEGTAAANLPGQVDDETRRDRRGAIMSLQAEISTDILEEKMGRELDILVEQAEPEWPGLFRGRAWFQAPAVDGMCYVSAPGEGQALAPGMLVRAEVVETKTYDLVALA